MSAGKTIYTSRGIDEFQSRITSERYDRITRETDEDRPESYLPTSYPRRTIAIVQHKCFISVCTVCQERKIILIIIPLPYGSDEDNTRRKSHVRSMYDQYRTRAISGFFLSFYVIVRVEKNAAEFRKNHFRGEKQPPTRSETLHTTNLVKLLIIFYNSRHAALQKSLYF